MCPGASSFVAPKYMLWGSIGNSGPHERWWLLSLGRQASRERLEEVVRGRMKEIDRDLVDKYMRCFLKVRHRSG